MADMGWGLLSQFPPFRYIPNFSVSQKHALAIEYHVYICQVSPQLSCGDTCHIWMWSKDDIDTFARSKILLTEKLANGAWVTPHLVFLVMPRDGGSKNLFINLSVIQFSILQKYLLDSMNHIHIWQVSPQLRYKRDI